MPIWGNKNRTENTEKQKRMYVNSFARVEERLRGVGFGSFRAIGVVRRRLVASPSGFLSCTCTGVTNK